MLSFNWLIQTIFLFLIAQSECVFIVLYNFTIEFWKGYLTTY